MSDRIPVLVVSGFLGSGKTTLVRHLLDDARRRGLRAAVVSNEFGELGIDAALLGGEGAGYVELEGGCVCCRLSDELVVTLQDLWEQVRPECVIVETSGVALPYDVQLNLWREPVSRWVGEDVAVVLVDAERLAAGEELGATFEQQVTNADLLLLNKTDRVDAAQLPRLEAALRALEPEAPIVRCVRARVDPVLLFPPGPRETPRRREPGAESREHEHEPFASEVVELEPGLAEAELLARLRALGALRIKGFARTDRGLRVVQGVGARIELQRPDAPPPPELVGRVVAIRRP